MPLLEGMSLQRTRGLRWTYELLVVGCAMWVVASLASLAAVVSFVVLNLSSLAIFDNRLVRRPIALRRSRDDSAFGYGAFSPFGLLIGAPCVGLLLGLHARWSMLLCVGSLVVTRFLMRPPPPEPRKPRLRTLVEWEGRSRR